MVTITDKEHFIETYNLAKKLGKKDPRIKNSFFRGLVIMNRLKRSFKGILRVSPDWVPYSFNWAILKDDKVVYNGGLEMYGGNWRNGSVTVSPVTYPEWRINT